MVYILQGTSSKDLKIETSVGIKTIGEDDWGTEELPLPPPDTIVLTTGAEPVGPAGPNQPNNMIPPDPITVRAVPVTLPFPMDFKQPGLRSLAAGPGVSNS